MISRPRTRWHMRAAEWLQTRADNLPGVPGVGEKTAAKLITTYGGLDGIFENLDAQTPKLRENLGANEANVRQNLELMVLVRDVPLDRSIGDLTWDRSAIDIEEVRRLFDFLEFRSQNMLDRLAEVLDSDLGPSTATASVVLEAEVETVATPAEAIALVTSLRALARRRWRSPRVGLVWRDGLRSRAWRSSPTARVAR